MYVISSDDLLLCLQKGSATPDRRRKIATLDCPLQLLWGHMAISATRRFLIGGVGGLAPVVALPIAVDFEKNFVNASNAQIAGYVVRAVALFAIGGFVAWLHELAEHKTNGLWLRLHRQRRPQAP